MAARNVRGRKVGVVKAGKGRVAKVNTQKLPAAGRTSSNVTSAPRPPQLSSGRVAMVATGNPAMPMVAAAPLPPRSGGRKRG